MTNWCSPYSQNTMVSFEYIDFWQKSCFLRPTIFKIPQPNWYYNTYIFLSDSDCTFHHMPVNCFGTGWGGQRTLVVVVRSASLVQESRHIDSSRRRFSELISRVNNCLGCSNDILKTNLLAILSYKYLSQWPNQLILVSFHYFDASRVTRGV